MLVMGDLFKNFNELLAGELRKAVVHLEAGQVGDGVPVV